MEIQFGKNPEITLSVCWNVHTWLGHITLPFAIEWYNNDFFTKSLDKFGACLSLGVWFLGIRFGIEIWKWKKEND